MGHSNNTTQGVKHSSVLLFIIITNALVFVGLRLISATLNLGIYSEFEHDILHQVELPASYQMVLTKPWTLVTYMFCQFDPSHLILNMLMLCLSGYYFTMAFGSFRFLLLYILGGVAGASAFIGYSTYFSGISSAEYLTGSSAAVFSIMTAVTILLPNKKVYISIFGDIKLKWIIIGVIAVDLYLSATGENIDGHIAHLGGVSMGILYGCITKLFRPSKKSRQAEPIKSINSSAMNPDMILNKIKLRGYASLTAEEREQIFEISNRMK